MAGFDASRVRIELCDVMSLASDMQLHARQGADIWLGDGDGKIQRSRKPHISLVDDTRSGVLRQIADWIESREDPGLISMAAEIAEAKAGRARGGA
jgi:hypothetical protein